MNIRRYLILSILAAGSVLFSGCTTLATPGKEHVVLHLTDKDPYRWNIIFNNSMKAMAHWGPEKMELEVVANAGGIQMLKADSPYADRVNMMINKGVKVVACEETMKDAKLTRDDMNPNISFVPRGNEELIRLHHAGWAYIKP